MSVLKRPLESLLVNHSAPTLAGIKTGNLFSCSFDSKNSLEASLKEHNKRLNPKGVFLTCLRQTGHTALIYVYRHCRLMLDFSCPSVQHFLRQYGYHQFEPEACIKKLCSRLKETEEFPHEIGLFLSYPLHDVKGYIRFGGKHSICSGCWKVYYNQKEAIKQFQKFHKCRHIYSRLFQEGRSLTELTVSTTPYAV